MLVFSTSPRFVEHDTGPEHPERPDRIRAICKAVRDAELINSPNPFPDFALDFGVLPAGGPRLIELTPSLADEKWPLLCHSAEHVNRIRELCRAGGGMLDEDTPVSPASYEIALLSLGSLLGCCDAVVRGEAQRAFSAGRPPGHHAEPERAMGFCLFSNVAIAAKYLQKVHGVGRVAIVDFDVHHGNGTQACLEDDPSVLFISLHQHPRTCYPGTGYEKETGVGAGEGFTLNLPMRPRADDEDYILTIQDRVVPALDAFRPEFLLLSAGFDGHRDDPLAHVNLSDDAFETMTSQLVQVANTHCGGRVVSALEGGYNLRALGRCVVRHLIGLRDT